MSSCWLGVFVGGRGRRLGGVDKSALAAPDGAGTLLERALALGRALPARCAIVGQPPGGVPAPAVAGGRAAQLTDDPPGIGPLGGLCALLDHAGTVPALALACDMPYVDLSLLRRLRDAPPAPVVAPRDPASGKWHPLFARYDPPRVLPVIRAAVAAGTRSFQTCFAELDVVELPMDEAEHHRLRDWDTPGDL